MDLYADIPDLGTEAQAIEPSVARGNIDESSEKEPLTKDPDPKKPGTLENDSVC